MPWNPVLRIILNYLEIIIYWQRAIAIEGSLLKVILVSKKMCIYWFFQKHFFFGTCLFLLHRHKYKKYHNKLFDLLRVHRFNTLRYPM